MIRFRTTHNDWDPNLEVPFVIVKGNADKIYVDPIWGINVERVLADGKAVEPVPHPVRLDDVNMNQIPIGMEPFVYLVRRLSLVFARSFTAAGEYELLKYNLPEKAKVVLFEYRLRETPETAGPVLTMESTLV